MGTWGATGVLSPGISLRGTPCLSAWNCSAAPLCPPKEALRAAVPIDVSKAGGGLPP